MSSLADSKFFRHRRFKILLGSFAIHHRSFVIRHRGGEHLYRIIQGLLRELIDLTPPRWQRRGVSSSPLFRLFTIGAGRPPRACGQPVGPTLAAPPTPPPEPYIIRDPPNIADD
jgi:hypothetical protein